MAAFAISQSACRAHVAVLALSYHHKTNVWLLWCLMQPGKNSALGARAPNGAWPPHVATSDYYYYYYF